MLSVLKLYCPTLPLVLKVVLLGLWVALLPVLHLRQAEGGRRMGERGPGSYGAGMPPRRHGMAIASLRYRMAWPPAHCQHGSLSEQGAVHVSK